MFLIKVLVQLPDGKFARLPVAKSRACVGPDGRLHDVTQVVRKEDEYWANSYKDIILPGDAYIEKEKE